VALTELQDYNRNFEQKIATFCQKSEPLTDDECKALGKKDEEIEVEKFITSNTQELGKDKWLCPLSGKKFKGPEFVRKHIQNKHEEKLQEVKKEVRLHLLHMLVVHSNTSIASMDLFTLFSTVLRFPFSTII